MLGYFPDPYPDELLYSVFARFSDMSRFSDMKDVHGQLFDLRSLRAVVDLPTHIDSLLRNLPDGHEYSANYFIKNHTLLPYYAPFLQPDRVQTLMKLMRGDGGRSVHLLSGVSPYNVPRPQYLKYCSFCCKEDEKKYGSSYWHRSHQLPGVNICPEHEFLLTESRIATANRKTLHAYIYLQSDILNSHTPVELPKNNHRHLIEIALDTQWLLSNWVGGRSLDDLHCTVRSLLESGGWLTASGKKIYMKELHSAFVHHYSAELLKKLNCFPGDNDSDDWLKRLLRKPRVTQHPLHYILLVRFLGKPVSSLFNPEDKGNVISQGPWLCLNQASGHYGKPLIKVPERQLPDGLIIRCPLCGLVYKQRYSSASSKPRIVDYGPQWHEKLLELVGQPNISVRKVSIELGVDPKTVERHLKKLRSLDLGESHKGTESVHQAKTMKYRSSWYELLKLYPNDTQTALRKRAPATFTWLYRHDREWLKINTPQHRRPKSSKPVLDWKQRDLEMKDQAEKAVQTLEDKPGKPVKITVTAIAREMGMLARIEHYREKLPQTWHYISSMAETREDYAVRRIRWVAEQYIQESSTPAKWQLIKKAGIRDDLMPALMNDIEHACTIINERIQLPSRHNDVMGSHKLWD